MEKIFKYFIFLSFFVSLISCGSGGGNGGGNNSGSEQEDAACSVFNNISLNQNISDISIDQDQTQCYSFEATEGQTYKISLVESAGDSEVALHSNTDLDENSVIAHSLFETLDELFATSESTTTLYIEVYGVLASRYSLIVTEIDSPITFGEQSLSFSGAVAENLQANQILINPDFVDKEVEIFVGSEFIKPNIADPTSNPTWLDFDNSAPLSNGSYNVTFSITDSNLIVGEHSTTVRFLSSGSHYRVYSDFTINLLVDSAPIVTDNSPGNIDLTQDTLFNVFATDPDNDPITYQLLFGPAGMEINNSGEASYSSTLPKFEDNIDINWAVRVLSNVSIIELYGTLSGTDLGRDAPLVRAKKPAPVIGRRQDGIWVANFDADPNNEVLVTDYNTLLYSMEFDGTDYVQEWVFPFAPLSTNRISSIALKDVNSDGLSEVFVGMSVDSFYINSQSSAAIVVLDGSTKKIIKTLHDDSNKTISAIQVDNIDSDNAFEIVYLTDDGKINIADLDSMTVEWSSPPFNNEGSSLAITNVDGDPAKEIVTAGRIIDAATHNIEWEINRGSFANIATGDLNNDGIDEIVADNLDILDAVNQVVIPSNIIGPGYVYKVSDVDNDGQIEVLADVRGTITAYNYDINNTQLVIDWAITERTFNGVTSVAYGDTDNDSGMEIIWAIDTNSTIPDSIVVAGLSPSPAIEWQTSNTIESNFASSSWLTNANGELSAYFTALIRPTANYQELLLEFDATSGNVTLNSENPRFGGPITGEDFTSDGVDEIVYYERNEFSTSTQGRSINILDPATKSTIWQSRLHSWDTFITHLSVGNITGAGNDIIALVNTGEIELYNTQNGSEPLSTISGDGLNSEIRLYDLDQDGDLEIVALYGPVANDPEIWKLSIIDYSAGNLVELNGKTFNFYDLTEALSINRLALNVGDVNADGNAEIIITTARNVSIPGESSEILRFNSSLQFTGVSQLNYAASNAFLKDNATDRSNLYIVQFEEKPAGDTSRIVSVDPWTGKTVWQSPWLLGGEIYDPLFINDQNSTMDRLIFGTDSAMYITQ